MLLVNEVYRTILGESRDAGLPCVIVRLTGCHRRCRYCDTAYAFQGGRRLQVEEVLGEVASLGCRTVLVTGGEPLLQQEVLPLLERLLARGHHVVLETSGTLGARPLAAVPPGVRRVVDVKTPGSGIDSVEIDWNGILELGPADELKFVCCDRRDYEWARELVRDGRRLPPRTPCTFSPAHGQLSPARLAAWILEDGLEVRLQIQLHKAVWPERDRGI
jgi:7-carboxy-7-deazaguanine synthase